jgi:LysM repeat protein
VRRATVHALAVLGAAAGLASCSTSAFTSATTMVNIGPTNFQTIPPLVSTIPVVQTTLPIGAVGVEQTYVIRQGDGPIKVSNLFGISTAELLAWNGMVSAEQWPFAGSTIRIPPTAQILNPVVPIAPDATAKPASSGCDARPAGTYKVSPGDSLFSIRKKFCVSTAALLAANGWPSEDVILAPNQVINIPPANQ